MQIPTPRLPIQLPQNASLTVQVYSGAFTTDPDTGNQTQSSLTVTVIAYLQRTLDKIRLQNLPGLNPGETYMEGWILSTVGREYFKAQTRCGCTLVTPGSSIPDQVGEFLILNTTHPHAATFQGIGFPIEGIFKQIGGAS